MQPAPIQTTPSVTKGIKSNFAFFTFFFKVFHSVYFFAYIEDTFVASPNNFNGQSEDMSISMFGNWLAYGTGAF